MNTLQRPSAVKLFGASGRLPVPARTISRAVVCSAKKQQDERPKIQLPNVKGAAAAALAAIMLTSAVAPEEAMAARSGGRVGGSSFRSSAPSRSAAPRSQTTVRNYNTYVSPAPPLVGGYGFGYGYGGISLFPTFVTPIGGGLFSFFFVAMIASAVLGVVRGAFQKKREDKWDD